MPEETGVASGRRGRRLRRATGRRSVLDARNGRVDVIVGTQNIKRLPMLVDAAAIAAPAGAPAASTSIRSTTCRFRWGLRAARIR